MRTWPLFVSATRRPSNPATWITWIGCCSALAPAVRSGRTGIEGRRFGSRFNSQGTQGITPSRGAEASLLLSLFISVWIAVSTCSENGHHTRISPERVSTQENIQPHSIWTGLKAGSLNTGDDNQKGWPQFTKFHIL